MMMVAQPPWSRSLENCLSLYFLCNKTINIYIGLGLPILIHKKLKIMSNFFLLLTLNNIN